MSPLGHERKKQHGKRRVCLLPLTGLSGPIALKVIKSTRFLPRVRKRVQQHSHDAHGKQRPRAVIHVGCAQPAHMYRPRIVCPAAARQSDWGLDCVCDGGHKSPLPPKRDEAILRLARTLARQAAREDHEREQADRRGAKEGRDLRPVFDRSSE